MKFILQLVLTTLLVGAAAFAGFHFKQQPTRVLEASPEKTDHTDDIRGLIAALPPGREHTLTVKLVGDFRITGAITLDSHTRVDLSEASISLVNGGSTAIFNNADFDEGDHHIEILGGILHGGRGSVEGKKVEVDNALACIDFKVVSDLVIRGTKLTHCPSHGIMLSGRGKKPRNTLLQDLELAVNSGHGLYIKWSVRMVTATNIFSHHNGRDGIFSDHSDSFYSNITASTNKGNGIFIRNVFGNSYNHLRAINNGQNGIYVVGMVSSSGLDWVAANNGTREGTDDRSDIFFSEYAELSYGRTAFTTISNTRAGTNRRYLPGNSRYAVKVEEPLGSENYQDLVFEGLRITNDDPGQVSIPADRGVRVPARYAD